MPLMFNAFRNVCLLLVLAYVIVSLVLYVYIVVPRCLLFYSSLAQHGVLRVRIYLVSALVLVLVFSISISVSVSVSISMSISTSTSISINHSVKIPPQAK